MTKLSLLDSQKKYMQRCITLAKNGLGLTYPNPLVGCVIVCDNKIIGEGWHKKAGEAHAEVNAINSVMDKSLLSRSTIYVSLEPCSHHGKTPPCADLIVKMKIKRAVVGTIDINSEVQGRGVEHLRKNGCEVEVGVLEEECIELNKRFFTFHQKKRPYIILKWAQTKDGFLYPEINKDKKEPIWISNSFSLQLVHKWRTEEESILVGTTTVINDNPNLNARKYAGSSPIRIAIDKDLKIPFNYNFYNENLQTIIFTDKTEYLENTNVHFEKINFSKDITNQIIKYLFDRGVQSLIIEGGARTLQSFIDNDLWDEARVFIGDKYFKKGIEAPSLKGVLEVKKNILEDKLFIYKND